MARPMAAMPLLWRGAAALAAAGACAFVLRLPQTDFAPDVPVPRPARPTTNAQPSARQAENASYPAIAARPLFYPTRTPWAPPPPPIEEPPPPAPSTTLTEYKLIGVIVSGTMRAALIKGPEGKTIFLDQGQTLDGWTLKQVDGNRLRFASGDAEYEMTLPKPSESGR